MPYVDHKYRLVLDTDIGYLASSIIAASRKSDSFIESDDVVGNLNYALTRVAVLVTNELSKTHNNHPKKKLSYALLNKIYGVLCGVATEFYRKVVTPYEQIKENVNGDVYTELTDTVYSIGVNKND